MDVTTAESAEKGWSAHDALAAFRAEYRAKSIGKHYSGWAHFTFTSLGSIAAIAFAISRVHEPTLSELAVAPAGFVVANLAEYFGHKGPMHHRKPGLGLLFRRHTLEHHHFFTNRAMTYESSRDFKMVLFPPVMLLFFLGGIATPIALLLFAIYSANAGYIFVATGVSYFLTYEWLHFAYHLPRDTWLGRRALVRVLRAHHEGHHDPALMGRYNFNITFPIADAMFGTIHRRERSGAPSRPE